MEYHFNNLDSTSFQRLFNGILVARFGEDIRLTPIRGADGGRDGETASGNPYFEFQFNGIEAPKGIFGPPRAGRYLFQVKHHNTLNIPPTEARRKVVSDFEEELKKNVLSRTSKEQINYFFLVTNVPASKEILASLDKKRVELLSENQTLHADVWWQEQVTAYLDQMPTLWNSFPNMFAGGKVPLLAEITQQENKGLSRAIRIAIARQYQQDSNVKFSQIDLEKNLSKLFVDLDVNINHLTEEEQKNLFFNKIQHSDRLEVQEDERIPPNRSYQYKLWQQTNLYSALALLLNETSSATRKIILEGGPGQGKSTITQIAAQIYRQKIIGEFGMEPEGRWSEPQKFRLPFRIELRKFAEVLRENPDASIEEYLANRIKKDASGSAIEVDDIYSEFGNSPVFLIFDGLDEVGNDELRDDVIKKITECVHTFQKTLHSDLRAVITTRPPAIAGHQERLVEFRQFTIAPLDNKKVTSYVERWLSVQLQDADERQEIVEAFNRRRKEPHVQVLARNPMQLAVLLHFVRLKREAFPDLRAELYRDYFQIVIERDVEKSPELRAERKIVEALHQFIGYKIHALTEAEQADGTLSRSRLLGMVKDWLISQGYETMKASDLFKVGHDRLGLIVALKGEGEETKYGYQIQPIQEYFAAAFINEQFEGNAHDIFPAMIRRPYWREVALFLAGLRRPNEKADLLLRIKELDNDEEWGWRQDGRKLTLQLLQEGVFSQPRLVFSNAIDYLLDLLDPKLVTIQDEPKDMLKALPSLIKHSETKKHTERLSNLIQNYAFIQDETVIYRLLSVSSQILEKDVIKKDILLFQNCSPDTKAKMLIAWPYVWKTDMKDVVKSENHWGNVPDKMRVHWLWQTFLHFESAIDLPAPAHFHQHFVEQFATSPQSITHILRVHPSSILNEPTSKWAIWRLIHIMRMIYMYNNNRFNNYIPKRAGFLILDFENTSYVGLEPLEKPIIKEFIYIHLEFLKSIVIDEVPIDKVPIQEILAIYVTRIRKYFRKPGLIGWLSCRCSTIILQSIFLGQEASFSNAIAKGSSIIPAINIILKKSGWSLWKLVKPFYKGLKSEDGIMSFFIEHFQDPISLNYVPDCLRLEENGEFVNLTDLLANKICYNKNFPFQWIEYIPLTTEIIYPLIDKCRDYLPNLLSYLSNIQFIDIYGGKSPEDEDLKSIIDIARATDNPNILTGSLIVLSTTKNPLLIGTELLLKLFQANQNNLAFVEKIFGYYHNVFSSERGLRGPKFANNKRNNPNLIEMLTEVATRVLKESQVYSFSTVSAAANHLAEYSPISLRPLLIDLEPSN